MGCGLQTSEPGGGGGKRLGEGVFNREIQDLAGFDRSCVCATSILHPVLRVVLGS